MSASHTASITPLTELLSQDMRLVNEVIIARMSSDVPMIPQLANHLIAAGGKRMRPLLCLAGAYAVRGADASGDHKAQLLSAAVEFIHNATLLHDDVIDESDKRRGRDTANALWGNEASVLVGDFLFARAFELMVETDDIAVLGMLSSASARITEGEVKQMTMAGKPDSPMADYLQVITGKTAILFAAAAASGAKVSGGSKEVIDAMHQYGLSLGMAFQIVDDALDYRSDVAAMGKNSGDDFVDGKSLCLLSLHGRKALKMSVPFGKRPLAKVIFKRVILQKLSRFWIVIVRLMRHWKERNLMLMRLLRHLRSYQMKRFVQPCNQLHITQLRAHPND